MLISKNFHYRKLFKMIVPTSLFPEQLDVNRIMHIYSPEDIDVLEESERNDVLIFWKRCILNYCLVNKTFVVSLQQLHSFYEIHDVVPSSLPSSFKNLVKFWPCAIDFNASKCSLIYNIQNSLGIALFKHKTKNSYNLKMH